MPQCLGNRKSYLSVVCSDLPLRKVETRAAWSGSGTTQTDSTTSTSPPHPPQTWTSYGPTKWRFGTTSFPNCSPSPVTLTSSGTYFRAGPRPRTTSCCPGCSWEVQSCFSPHLSLSFGSCYHYAGNNNPAQHIIMVTHHRWYESLLLDLVGRMIHVSRFRKIKSTKWIFTFVD